MNMMEMLTAREQLMEDIDAIVDEYFEEYGITNDPELVKVLCDAVCRNFPTKWYKPVSRPTSWHGVTLEVAIRQTLCL